MIYQNINRLKAKKAKLLRKKTASKSLNNL